MGSFQTNRGSALSDINVTPLVDVMLVLLVIFMVTAPLIHQGVKVDLPQAKTADLPRENRDLIVTVDAQRKVYILDQEFDLKAFAQKIRAIFKETKGKSVYLAADRSLPYDVVIKTMAAIKDAGYGEVGLITEPEALDEQTRRR